jgi:solute carrier family 13 (sodium-dependent dicarboxylate transporter), member 2/3/5
MDQDQRDRAASPASGEAGKRSETSGFDRWRATIGLVLGPVLMLVMLIAPFPGLTTDQFRLAAIVALVITFWVTEAIPLPVTALLGVVLIVVFGVAPAPDVLTAFGDQVIFLFIGSFMLARAMQLHGLDLRIAYALLAHPWVGGSTYRTIWALGLTGWLLSMWISNTASVAMLFPVAVAIAHSTVDIMRQQGALGLEKATQRYTAGLLLMLAYSSSVGGIATPVGTPPNLIGIALIDEGLGVRIQFLEWMSFALPAAIILLGIIFGIIMLLFRPPVRSVPGQLEMMQERREELGPWTAGQRNALIAFSVAVILWISPGIVGIVYGSEADITTTFQQRVPEGIAALAAASLLFLLPVNWKRREFTLNWSQAARIDWGTVLLFGGGIAIGRMLFATGLAAEMGDQVIALLGVQTEGAVTAAAVAAASLISETSSNTASVNVVVPVMLSVAETVGLEGLVVAIGATLGSSMGFMLPVSTPPNAIIYGSGEVRITDMIKAGFLLDIIGIIVVWAIAIYWIPIVLDVF